MGNVTGISIREGRLQGLGVVAVAILVYAVIMSSLALVVLLPKSDVGADPAAAPGELHDNAAYQAQRAGERTGTVVQAHSSTYQIQRAGERSSSTPTREQQVLEGWQAHRAGERGTTP